MIEKKRSAGIIFVLLIGAASVFGCSKEGEIKPQDAAKGKYATLTAMPAHEYTVFMAKEVNVAVNELESRIIDARNVEKGNYPKKDAVKNVTASLKRMEDVINEVDITMPAKTYEDDRKDCLRLLKNGCESMREFQQALEKSNTSDITKAKKIMMSDINSLTGVANVFYQ